MDISKCSPDEGDIDKRHHVAPLVVATALVPDTSGGSDHSPYALLLTIDVDAVPGFREIVDRQRAGEEFDVFSRWGAAMDETGEHAPLAMVDLYMPEFDLGISIEFSVDEHPRSILGAIQTGVVFILDPASWERLQEEDEAGAYLEHIRAFTVRPTDPKVLMGVLQQRYDLPLEGYEPERAALTNENREEVLASVLAYARSVERIGVSFRGDGPATIFLVDSGVAALKAKISEGANVEGRWGALLGDDRNLVFFDAFAPETHIGRWVFVELPAEVLRAGSNGAHTVIVATELPNGDDGEFDLSDAIVAWVPNVEVLRGIRFGEKP